MLFGMETIHTREGACHISNVKTFSRKGMRVRRVVGVKVSYGVLGRES